MIDAPDLGEPCYEEAKFVLTGMVEGRKVLLEKDSLKDKDIYGRLLRYVFLEGRPVNCELLRLGLGVKTREGRYECF